jgi:hypothetical protein
VRSADDTSPSMVGWGHACTIRSLRFSREHQARRRKRSVTAAADEFVVPCSSLGSSAGRCIVHRSSIGHSLAASPDPATQGMTRSVRRRSNHLPATPATFCTSGRSREGAYRCRRFRTSRRTCRLGGLSNSSLIAGARASISPARPASATAYPAIRGLHRGDSWLYRSHALRDLDSQINQAPRSPVASRFGES